MKTKISIIVAAILLSACTSMKLTPEGEKVRVLDPGEIDSCRELGKTSTSVTHIVVGIPRPIETITKELRAIARNSASRMGGDTIVPLTVIEEGKQTFLVYKCVNPDG